MEVLPIFERSVRRISDAPQIDTREQLIASARAIFIETGYASASTPEIVRRAGLTRGALYHYFENKADLFYVVALAEAQAIASEIRSLDIQSEDPQKALIDGAMAYFSAMKQTGRTKLLLVEAPSVLGPKELKTVEHTARIRGLREGLTNLARKEGVNLPIDALTELLSSMFDKAALSIAEGNFSAPYEVAIKLILRSLVAR
ncbi:MAG: TetR/AcrR family transcriptional regulator [Pseudomonadota bacterium]